MTSVFVDPWIHRRLEPKQNCRNGLLVSAEYQSQIAALANQVARLRPKELASFHGHAEADINTFWRFAAHTSPLCGAIVARLTIAKVAAYTDPDTLMGPLVPNPVMWLTIQNGSGATLAEGNITCGYSYGETVNDVPDEWTVQTIVLDASTFQNTSIRGTLNSLTGGRIIGATIYEYPMPPDTANGYISQQFAIGQPIMSSHREDLVTMAIEQWKYGAAQLGNFSSSRDADAATVTAAAYRNVWDASLATARAPASPCWMPDLRYCNTKRSTTVPCRFEAYAGYSGAGSGTVRIVDLSGTVLASVAVSGSAAWYQTTCNLPATSAPYYLEHVSDGANTMKTYCASLYQYLA